MGRFFLTDFLSCVLAAFAAVVRGRERLYKRCLYLVYLSSAVGRDSEFRRVYRESAGIHISYMRLCILCLLPMFFQTDLYNGL